MRIRGYRQKRQLCSVRIPIDDYNKVKVKIAEQGLNFQKLMEIFFYSYLKDTKASREILKRYVDDSPGMIKSKNELDDVEIEKMRALLEENSPLTIMERELKKEQERNNEHE